mmetsp:Transcript_4902/g.16059  ORF Transcript_4902/g.16059 Transcript_4902/m.16059 type:complete len:244 (-) Transcript_4902:25-756(-)
MSSSRRWSYTWLLLILFHVGEAFVVVPRRRRPPRGGGGVLQATAQDDAEEALVGLLGQGRVALSAEEEQELEACLAALPRAVPSRADVEGDWALLYTTKSAFDPLSPLGRRVDGTAPGLEALFPRSDVVSSSPVQRLLTSLESVDVEQNVRLDEGRVDQLVKVRDAVELRLSAAAVFDEKTGRIDFTFDLAYFLVAGIKIPYPVPFRLLGDEAKGWIDTAYASKTLRVSTGNKGTTFILKRRS